MGNINNLDPTDDNSSEDTSRSPEPDNCNTGEHATACTPSSHTSADNEVKTVDWNVVAELVAEMVLIKYRREQLAASSANDHIPSESKTSENINVTEKESGGLQ